MSMQPPMPDNQAILDVPQGDDNDFDNSAEVLDIEEILHLHADYNRRPLINLCVNNVKTTFLCDSGACRSVLNSSAGPLPMSDDAMAIKTELKMLTQPIVLYDPETTLQTTKRLSSPDGMTPFRPSATGGPEVHNYFPREENRTGVG